MKTLVVLLALVFPILLNAQSLPEIMSAYQAHCDSIVQCETKQEGTIPIELIPVKEDVDGEIIYYKQVYGDTIWSDVFCPEYQQKFIGFGEHVTFKDRGWISTTPDGTLYRSPKEEKIKNVSRNVVCECKYKENRSFYTYFWNWVEENY